MIEIDAVIDKIERLTAALEAAVLHAEFDKAVSISLERETLLKKLNEQNKHIQHINREEVSKFADQILKSDKKLISILEIEKGKVSLELKKLVKSNKALSIYHSNR